MPGMRECRRVQGRPGRDVVDAHQVGIYHVWSRCVRRAWLRGQGPVTGKDCRLPALLKVRRVSARKRISLKSVLTGALTPFARPPHSRIPPDAAVVDGVKATAARFLCIRTVSNPRRLHNPPVDVRNELSPLTEANL